MEKPLTEDKTLYFDIKLKKLRYTTYKYKDPLRFIPRVINIKNEEGIIIATSDKTQDINHLTEDFIEGYIKRYNKGRIITETEIVNYSDDSAVIRFKKTKDKEFTLDDVEVLMRKSFHVGYYQLTDANNFIKTELLNTKIKQNDYVTFPFSRK